MPPFRLAYCASRLRRADWQIHQPVEGEDWVLRRVEPMVPCADSKHRGAMQDFRKLRVWQAANQLTTDVYNATRAFPAEERFGLTAQLRSAAVSIQSNIAEGFGRGSRADTCRFLQMSTGSAAEVASHLGVALSVGYLSADAHRRLDDATSIVRKMLIRLLLRLKSQIKYSPTWRKPGW